MSDTYTIDTTNRRWVDSDGFELRVSPILFYKHLTEWTLNFKTNDGQGNLTNDTQFASAAAFSIGIDNDFIHELRGNLTAAKSGAVTEITIDGITVTPPDTGEIILENSAGERETVAYTAWTLSTGVYTFTVSATLTYTYADNDSADVKEELMVKIENGGIDSTNKATGVFIATIDTDTRGYLLSVLDSASATEPIFEFTAYDGSGNKIQSYQLDIVCRNIIENDAATPPAAPASNYYTKTESDARYIMIGGSATYIDLEASDGNVVRLEVTLISGTDYKITLTKQ